MSRLVFQQVLSLAEDSCNIPDDAEPAQQVTEEDQMLPWSYVDIGSGSPRHKASSTARAGEIRNGVFSSGIFLVPKHSSSFSFCSYGNATADTEAAIRDCPLRDKSVTWTCVR